MAEAGVVAEKGVADKLDHQLVQPVLSRGRQLTLRTIMHHHSWLSQSQQEQACPYQPIHLQLIISIRFGIGLLWS